jgi:hypothetical protein
MRVWDPIRRIVDREWIKVDWCGRQTLVHRLLSVVPIACAGVLSSLLSSRTAGIILLTAGFLSYFATSMWIEGRRMAGTGAFSTRRSDKFVKRMRQRRIRPVDRSNEHE